MLKLSVILVALGALVTTASSTYLSEHPYGAPMLNDGAYDLYVLATTGYYFGIFIVLIAVGVAFFTLRRRNPHQPSKEA